MGPLPYQPLFLSFFAESCYLDSNAQSKNSPGGHRPRAHGKPGPRRGVSLISSCAPALRVTKSTTFRPLIAVIES